MWSTAVNTAKTVLAFTLPFVEVTDYDTIISVGFKII